MKEAIENIAIRRGFFWQSSAIYGGISGLYDYAPIGTMLKRGWENLWRSYIIGLDDNFFEIETSDIMPENVFVASGHLANFTDPVVKCKKCGTTYRADHILEDRLKESFEGLTPEGMSQLIKQHDIKCEKCKGLLEDVGTLNMMFPVSVGVEKPVTAYLRPETVQGPYVNFKRTFEVMRKKLPLGLAVIGKAYRNEISPRNALLRMREFTQAELQIFFDSDKINEHPKFDEIKDYVVRIFPVENKESGKTDEVKCSMLTKKLPKFYVYHMAKMQQFYLDILKLPKEKLRFRELSDEERAFYNKFHFDVELQLSIGWKEVGGLHYRTDHDLGGHEKISKQDMSVNIDGKKFIPHVLELSFGVDRNVYALLDVCFKEERERTLFSFPRLLSPFDCAAFPLVNKDNIPEKSLEIKGMLKNSGFSVFYDDSGSIGRRYRRMDEIGVALCITIDHQTLEDDTVTIRDRDSMKQARVATKKLESTIRRFLQGEKIENLGEIVK